MGYKRKKKGRARGIDQVRTLFLFFRNFFVGLALRPAFFGGPGKRPFQFFQLRAISCGIHGLAVWTYRNAIDSGACRDRAGGLNLRRLRAPVTFKISRAPERFRGNWREIFFFLLGNPSLKQRPLPVEFPLQGGGGSPLRGGYPAASR